MWNISETIFESYNRSFDINIDTNLGKTNDKNLKDIENISKYVYEEKIIKISHEKNNKNSIKSIKLSKNFDCSGKARENNSTRNEKDELITKNIDFKVNAKKINIYSTEINSDKKEESHMIDTLIEKNPKSNGYNKVLYGNSNYSENNSFSENLAFEAHQNYFPVQMKYNSDFSSINHFNTLLEFSNPHCEQFNNIVNEYQFFTKLDETENLNRNSNKSNYNYSFQNNSQETQNIILENQIDNQFQNFYNSSFIRFNTFETNLTYQKNQIEKNSPEFMINTRNFSYQDDILPESYCEISKYGISNSSDNKISNFVQNQDQNFLILNDSKSLPTVFTNSDLGTFKIYQREYNDINNKDDMVHLNELKSKVQNEDLLSIPDSFDKEQNLNYIFKKNQKI